MWHYSYGSQYDTPFWDTAKKLKIKDSLFDKILAEVKLSTMIELLAAENQKAPPIYGQWGKWNFKCWHDGMTKGI